MFRKDRRTKTTWSYKKRPGHTKTTNVVLKRLMQDITKQKDKQYFVNSLTTFDLRRTAQQFQLFINQTVYLCS